MMNLILVAGGTTALVWVLFFLHPNARKTLSASRWMILAWGALLLVHIFSPITYHVYELSATTVIYALLWIGLFVLGDIVGANRLGGPSRALRLPVFVWWQKLPQRRLVTAVTFLSILGIIYLTLSSRGLSSVTDLAQLRQIQVTGAQSGLGKTVATILAAGGLIAYGIELSTAILTNRRIRPIAWIALMAYFAMYYLSAGRSGMVLGGLTILTVMLSSLQIRRGRYRFARHLFAAFGILLLLIFAYVTLIVTTRTNGWAGTMDNKIMYINVLQHSELDTSFRESLRPLGSAGDTVIEVFFYLAPQLYGFEHSVDQYSGPMGFGTVQFPYVTRRLEQLFGIDLLQPIIDADQMSYEKFDLAPNFFRTALHTTFLDFGLLGGLIFSIINGFLAGRVRRTALRLRSPLWITLQGLICAGAAWTIIFSPYVEQGWAFPLILILGTIFLSRLNVSTTHRLGAYPANPG